MGKPIAILLSVVGVCLGILVSGPFLRHALGLGRHLSSGDWEVVSNKPYLDEYLRGKYKGQSAEWNVSFLAGSGRAYSLLPRHRHDTLREIGHATLRDTTSLLFTTTPLPVAYGALLQDALRKIEEVLDPTSGSALRALERSIRRSVDHRTGKLDLDATRKAQEVLSRQSKTSVLRQALQSYSDFADARGLDFPSFEVGSDPPFDSPRAWDASSVVLPQQSRCRGVVSTLGDATDTVEASVVSYPRLVEVSLDRRWLSDALLDELASSRGSSFVQFQQDGPLRLIPKDLWVLLPEAITITPLESRHAPLVDAWIVEGTCCRISCSDTSVRLSPDSVRRQQDGAYFGIRSDVEPVLYAIASRRRLQS